MIHFPMFFYNKVEEPESWRDGCKRVVREKLQKWVGLLPEEDVRKGIYNSMADYMWRAREAEQVVLNQERRLAYDAKKWHTEEIGALRTRLVSAFANMELPWQKPGFRGGMDTLWAKRRKSFAEIREDILRAVSADYGIPCRYLVPRQPEPIGEMAQMLDDIKQAEGRAA